MSFPIIFVWLNRLSIGWKFLNFRWDRMLNYNVFASGVIKFHKERFSFKAFCISFLVKLMPLPEMSCSSVAQVCARRMANQ